MAVITQAFTNCPKEVYTIGYFRDLAWLYLATKEFSSQGGLAGGYEEFTTFAKTLSLSIKKWDETKAKELSYYVPSHDITLKLRLFSPHKLHGKNYIHASFWVEGDEESHFITRNQYPSEYASIEDRGDYWVISNLCLVWDNPRGLWDNFKD